MKGNDEMKIQQAWFLYECAMRKMTSKQVDKAIIRGRNNGVF